MAVQITESEDAVRAGEVLARAFQTEPLAAWQIPDEQRRAALLPGHFERVVRLAQRTGEVWRSDGFDALACWIEPARWPPTEAELVESGVPETEALVGADAWERFEVVYAAIDEAHRRVIADPHWDLWVLGVLPEAQGRGIATALVGPMLRRMDAAGEICYLETLDERSLGLYSRLGFDVVLSDTEPVSRLSYWCCLRRPRSGAVPHS